MANFKKLTHIKSRKVQFEYNNGRYHYEYYYEFGDGGEFEETLFFNLDNDEEIESGTELYHKLKTLASNLNF